MDTLAVFAFEIRVNNQLFAFSLCITAYEYLSCLERNYNSKTRDYQEYSQQFSVLATVPSDILGSDTCHSITIRVPAISVLVDWDRSGHPPLSPLTRSLPEPELWRTRAFALLLTPFAQSIVVRLVLAANATFNIISFCLCLCALVYLLANVHCDWCQPLLSYRSA